jgi:HAE1 family hydrophobic/amphiphilic exporter-1
MTIYRRNGRQYVTTDIAFRDVKFSQAGELALAAAREVEAPSGVDLALGGATRAIDEAMSELTLALCLAAVLVYMVMAVQYESLLYPLIIMFTMPLAAIGAIGLLAAAGESISVTAIIGLIVLAGVVVNNGIVMVDFINQLKATGMKTPEAVRKASLARLRPILMTALTTILGLLPMAMGRAAGSELERPLALTVIGGLTTATFLTLFVIPIIYELMDEVGHRLSHRGVH